MKFQILGTAAAEGWPAVFWERNGEKAGRIPNRLWCVLIENRKLPKPARMVKIKIEKSTKRTLPSVSLQNLW